MINAIEMPIGSRRSQPGSGEIHEGMAALLPAEQEAIMLVCVKGLSYRDAAYKLGISSGALQEHLLRGRLALIAKLKLKG
jgi:RNA polymerase sigma-70 factor (ECF subfamily)